MTCAGARTDAPHSLNLIYLYFLFYFNFLLHILNPSFFPHRLNLHNRPDDDCVAGDEEVLLEGVDAEMEAEEIGHQDLSVGVVNYEEPGPRGSASHFLIGVEMEGDPPGNDNRPDDDCVAGDEEVLLEGVDAEMEAEEIGHQDLSVGVVCKNYEEPGRRGSAAHFLLGVEIEGHPPGNENVEGGALTAVSAYSCSNINDSNKCQSSSPIDDDAVDVESAAAAVDVHGHR